MVPQTRTASCNVTTPKSVCVVYDKTDGANRCPQLCAYQTNMNDQEESAEQYVMAFLAEQGIETNHLKNTSVAFLTGIYNGLVIATKMMNLGLHPADINKNANIFAIYISARKRMVKDILQKHENKPKTE